MSTLPPSSRMASNSSTGSCPQFPAPKSRKSLPIPSDSSRAPSPSQVSFQTRTPSSPRQTPGRPLLSNSMTNAGTSRTVTGSRVPSSPDKSLRRTISIAAFPQPPKAGSRPSTASSISGIQGVHSSGSVKVRKSSRLSTGTTSSYRSSKTASLLCCAGDAKSILTMEARDTEASPSQSRSSSAQGSYSTSATTFEDAEEGPGAPKSMSKLKETKGNVIVSVRVRPDANGGEITKAAEWMVDGRQGVISYNGREGGDYSYGKNIRAVLFELYKEILSLTSPFFLLLVR